MRRIEYDVDGTAKYANVTCTNAKGATEQKQVKLPYHESFYVNGGSFVAVAAQKTRVTRLDPLRIQPTEEILSDGKTGTVHASIRVNGVVLQEATSDAPFGIASVSGRVAE